MVILEKPGILDEAEFQFIRECPLVSYVLNAAYWGDENHLCAEVALNHREDRLGQGYPRRIKTNSLILDILALVDRFDALVSARPFRPNTFSVREAFDIIKKDVDTGRFEADVLKVFVALVRKEKIADIKKDLKKINLGTVDRAS